MCSKVVNARAIWPTFYYFSKTFVIQSKSYLSTIANIAGAMTQNILDFTLQTQPVSVYVTLLQQYLQMYYSPSNHILGVDLCLCLTCITNPYSVEHFKKTCRQVFKMESTHLSVLLQQHLVQDWLDPIVKCVIVFIGHQKVPDPTECKWHT